jgi:hypothetical protein
MKTNLEEMLLGEFNNFRSYVSHTLCKNRLFLYLDAKDSDMSFKAIIEPNVWPILKSEIISLFALGPSLYGINCPSVFVEDRKKAEQSIREIDEIRDGGSKSIADFRRHAEIIRDVLAGIQHRFLVEAFSLNVDTVNQYLGWKKADDLRNEISRLIRANIIPLIDTEGDDLVMTTENEVRFWEFYPSVMLLIRECLNACIIEEKSEKYISDIKSIMYSVIRCDLPELLKYQG